MRKTSKPNKLNHKPQAHARVCEENQEKNDCLLKYFAVKRSTLEACRRTVTKNRSATKNGPPRTNFGSKSGSGGPVLAGFSAKISPAGPILGGPILA